jgi:hypothetical protein
MIILGFTGTRKGLTEEQRNLLRLKLSAPMPGSNPPLLRAYALHHGGALGADDTAHWLALELQLAVHVWPSNIPNQHATLGGEYVRHDEAPPLERNHTIVDQCDELIACPGEMEEVLRSGTWATIRYARRIGKPITIIYPDGSANG